MAVVLVVLLPVAAGIILLTSRTPPRSPTVVAASSRVLLSVSDIPQIGWGEWANGTDGPGAWRFFAVHNELIAATLNVTLWVEPSADAARTAMDRLAENVTYTMQDAGIAGADASAFWTINFGQYGGSIVRRYNVVFLLSAHLETSFALTKSDFGRWSGWQINKLETFAA